MTYETKKLNADTISVISAYLRLRGEHTVLLESVPTSQEKSRYSILGLEPVHEFKATGKNISIDGTLSQSNDPLQTLSDLVVTNSPTNQYLPFQGGAIGYVGFDAIAAYENIGKTPFDDLNMPDIHMFLYETFIIFDHQKETLTIVADNVYSHRHQTQLHAVIAEIESRLRQQVDAELVERVLPTFEPKSNMTVTAFTTMVNRIKQLISAGDVFQMVPSQRFSFDFNDDPFDFYRQLRRTNPSPYMYYMDLGDVQQLGSL